MLILQLTLQVSLKPNDGRMKVQAALLLARWGLTRRTRLLLAATAVAYRLQSTLKQLSTLLFASASAYRRPLHPQTPNTLVLQTTLVPIAVPTRRGVVREMLVLSMVNRILRTSRTQLSVLRKLLEARSARASAFTLLEIQSPIWLTVLAKRALQVALTGSLAMLMSPFESAASIIMLLLPMTLTASLVTPRMVPVGPNSYSL